MRIKYNISVITLFLLIPISIFPFSGDGPTVLFAPEFPCPINPTKSPRYFDYTAGRPLRLPQPYPKITEKFDSEQLSRKI